MGNDEYDARRGLDETCQMFPSATLILSAGWKGLKVLLSVSMFANPAVGSIQESLYSRVLIGNDVLYTSKVH